MCVWGVLGVCVGMYVRVCEGLMRGCVCRVCMHRGVCRGSGVGVCVSGGNLQENNLPFHN